MRDFIPGRRAASRRVSASGAKGAVNRRWARHIGVLPVLGVLVAGTLVAAAGPVPDSVIFIDRGKTYNDRGEWDSAIHALDRAIKLEPYSYNAFLNRGNAYRGKG